MALRPRRTSRALLAPLTVLAVAAAPVLVAGGAAEASPRPSSLDPGLSTSGSHPVKVVVSGRSVALARAAALAAGATRVRPLAIVDGVSATVPADRLAGLARAAGVTAVTADRAVRLSGSSWDTSLSASPYAWTSQAVPTWQQTGTRGTGIGIAVLDTGVSAVGDLAGRLVQGPDLSGEGNNTVDSYGHGTVMAGIAAGDGTANGSQPLTGVAPGATVVAVKVAGANGATDVSTVLAGLTWVAAFKDTYNIRVLNLSWGVPSTQDPSIDPLDFAVERLWNLGVTVVVAAGNAGPSTGTVLKPGDDPLVVTVGAYDDKGDAVAANDAVPAWSSQGPTAQGRAKPDLVAPGRTLVATRAPGSTVEAQNPDALVGSAYIKGSGTSEATAVTSGAAALVLAAHPSWTPDQVKYALTSTATRIYATPATAQGAGRLQTQAAVGASVLLAPVQVSTALGTGSLDGSRGQAAPVSVTCPDGVSRVVAGNATTWCAPFDTPTWASSAWTSSAWTSSAWTSSAWTSSAWTSSAWTSSAWTSSAWTSSAWTSSAWTSSAWTSSAWTSSAWTSSAWTSSAWTSSAWTSSAWTGDSWGTGDPDDFQTAFWGDRPRFGHRVAGEVSELVPDFALGIG